MEPTDSHGPGTGHGAAAPGGRWPWRSALALAAAVAAAVAAHEGGTEFGSWLKPGPVPAKIVTAATATAFGLLSAVAIIGFSGKMRDLLQPVTGPGHAAVVRYAAVLLGGVASLVVTLDLFKLPVGQLAVGAGLTTILLGIAAQQSLGNVFAGLVLLLSRPFGVGDRIHLRSGALNGPLEGTVTEIGITYLRLDTGVNVLHVPNSQALAAAVARLTPPDPGPADGQPTRDPGG